ncbi:glycoside hydrolase family 2 TIM barrel-domain containing protein [Draconibacterium sp. IB214405]|uniref:glycoside hydrolase family 2 TIM barrel-domain containing protein n=1 Tax=Draconibacterium sp. IB214405 TaxID=3097352 RepID=UPI002A0CE989|nr:glycoside hydrolase family 2 TIM barrel-domain containing protein [Draconibacterium sp. IB214405]MDX8340697.1 glycoside hydrolase family 2 TIM barrel-domain containing protein [Draconibacterium sp. IB214405]
MPKIFFSLFVFLLGSLTFTSAQNTIDLSGEWQVFLEPNHELEEQYPNSFNGMGKIELPASLAEKGFGYRTTGSDFGILTPEFKFIGKARYSREIEIPADWKNKEVEILLERVLWESRIFIDGKELSKADALGTPHIHRIGEIKPGKHQLTVLVDNDLIHNIGDKGHAYGEYTQSIWNGVVGKMEMRALNSTRFQKVNIYPDVENEKLSVKTEIQSESAGKTVFSYEIVSVTTGEVVLQGDEKVELSTDSNEVDFVIDTKSKLKKWSEFTPEVYLLKSKLHVGENTDETETEFGFYQLSHNGTKLLVNGNPVFLRGNLDCVHFPLTGYASCKLEDWERIFRIYKEYGLNHARFHSWCPSEAAFKAANRVGIYLQAEASIWIDWWMSVDNTERGRPEMNTKGFPKGLGFDEERDKFVVAEMNRMVETYGNHPSFTMFCIGNELGNSDFDVMKQWVADLKKKDPRRLYAVSTARTITEFDDYSATHYIKDVGRTRGLNGAHTNWDFEKVYSQMNIPIIAHEIGQWPVYPKWSEIDKYKGVLKARNFEEFKVQAEKNGIGEQDEEFAKASGALNQLMYKYETESFFRTESCAGIQLLSMQDYQGQGEALVGWLDAHWDSKGIVEPQKFKEHYNTTVPLLRMDKFVWTTDESFEAEAQVSHHGEQDLTGICTWKIVGENDKTLSKGTFGKFSFKRGTLTDLGQINYPLNNITKAQQLTVSIEIEDTEFRNEWNIWVFPAEVNVPDTGDVLVAKVLDEKTKEALENGAKVLLVANKLGTKETSVNINFYPLYWSLTFFPGQGKTCIGMLLQDEHPAFNQFPTSYHSDWQWETISKEAKGFILNELPKNYKPIAQPVDDFHRNNKLGAIFEFEVGKGKILVCGFDIDSDKPVAFQLKSSLLEYMNSGKFNPKQEVEFSWLQQMLPEIPKAEEANVPDEFKNAVLYVDAAANLKKEGSTVSWEKELDEIKLAKETSYQLKADGVWKEKDQTLWHGKKMNLQINCPEGMLGTLYVQFSDFNKKGRTGMLEFEGRKSKLGLHHGDGVWVKFHVMREDSNDGKLILKTETETGGNLMISKIVLVKE